MKKKILGLLVLFIVIAAFFGGFYLYKIWWPEKQLKVDNGLSEPRFPWWDYSEAELEEMYPQIKNAAIPTRTTPEETYANFREALRTNNLELAVEQLSKSSEKTYQEHKKTLEDLYQKGEFMELYKAYSEEIKQEITGESVVSYYYLENKDGHNLRQSIGFVKDTNGDWKMGSL